MDPQPQAEPPQSSWRATAAALARESMRNPSPADTHFDQVDSAVAAARSLRGAPEDRFGDYEAQNRFDQEAHSDYADDAYADDAYADTSRGGASFGDRQYGAHRADASGEAAEDEGYFFDGATAPADAGFYDDPPRRRRSSGLITAVVLVGCGILGTAGAYGYRTYYSGGRASDAPIIAPDKAPNKIVPAQASNDSSQPAQEGAPAANERVVTRQEEPVAIADAPQPPRNGSVLPPPFTPSPGPGPSVQAGPPTPAGATTEPKKVRTVAIRPEGAVDPFARPVPGSAPPQTASPAVPGRQQAARPTPTPTPTTPAPARSGGGPLSLDPQASPETGEATPPPRTASRGAPAPTPRLASTASGGYVVQVSSQRSEADAQASFQSLQSKYPRELGDREPIVRRADLGAKGVYYRTLVGPFGSAADANQLCSDLKADGGQCIVQKN